MAIAYLLSVIWGLAFIAGCFGFMRELFFDVNWGWTAVGAIVMAPVVIFFAAVPLALTVEASSPVLATLHKGAWICGSGHMQIGMAGKVPTRTFVCDQYNRR